ncbi:MAG: hypothetical protein ACR65O_00220 [Methylomicrobium sp.]
MSTDKDRRKAHANKFIPEAGTFLLTSRGQHMTSSTVRACSLSKE